MNKQFKEFNSIIDEMKKIHMEKNHDYDGNKNYLSSLKSSVRMGIPAWKSVVIRIQDKLARLENFVISGKLKVKDESIEDTLKDLANYAILCLILYRDETRNE